MGLEERLEEFKSRVLMDMQTIINKGDTKDLIACSRVLEACEALFDEISKIDRNLRNLVDGFTNGRKIGSVAMRNYDVADKLQSLQDTQVIAPFVSQPTTEISKKSVRSDSLKKAQQTRDEISRLLAIQHSLPLTPQSKTVYVTNTGEPIGIAFATERTPGRWFLGLPILDYRGVVLVCEVSSFNQKRFVLPRRIWRTIAETLSRSGDQIKFNIRARGGQYELLLLGGDAISINHYVDAFGELADGAMDR